MGSQKHRVYGVVAATMLLVTMAFVGGALVAHPAPSGSSSFVYDSASGSYFDYLVVVVMENKNLCEIYTHCGGTATYMTGFADAGSMLLDYRYGNVNPSLPNYLALSGGTTFGCTSNVDPNSGCATGAWDAPNVVDRLDAGGVSWKAYMEDMPSNCYGGNSGGYAVRHNPFVYYRLNVETPERCNKIIPAGTNDDALVNDLGSTSTASNFMWLTPNNCNNMHDCPVATGDAYLASLVPRILASNVFTTQRAALFVVFDEGYDNPTYAAWSGPMVKTAFTTSTYYDAYSFLQTLWTNWNLQPLTTNDQNATPMSEVFGAAPAPNFSLSSNPQSLSFVAGQSAQATVSFQPTGGFNGTVDLSGYSIPAGITIACVPSIISGSQKSSCILSGTTEGSYAVTITGTSGALSHTTPIAVTVNPPEPGPDTTPPQVEILSPTNESTINTTSVTVAGSASDNVAIQSVEVSTDGTTWTAASGTSSWSARITLGPGSHRIYARATDTAGNRDIVEITVIVDENASPPGKEPTAVPLELPFGMGVLLILGTAFAPIFLVLAFLFLRGRMKGLRKQVAEKKREIPDPPAP